MVDHRWRTVPAMLLTFLGCLPWVTSISLTSEQQAELDELLASSAAAFDSLAAGSRAGDEIRLLHGKLRELSEVATHTHPHEWDAMLDRLLRDGQCGAAALRRALRSEGKGDLLPLRKDDPGDESRRCGGTEGRRRHVSQPGKGAVLASHPAAHPGRRILQVDRTGHRTAAEGQGTGRIGNALAGRGGLGDGEALVDDGARGGVSQPRAGLGAAGMTDGSAKESYLADAGELRRSGWGDQLANRWRRWLLDRPPPWERDCDCCFEKCPDGFHCLAQGDGLVLACRGDSVGELLHKQWLHAPLTVCLAVGAVVGATILWARAQHRQLREVQQLRKRSRD
jgi:hypothetical protein